MLLWGLTVLAGLPILIGTVFGYGELEMYSEEMFQTQGQVFVMVFLSGVFNLALQGAICFTVYKILRGESVDFFDSLARGLKRFPTMLVIILLLGLVVIGFFAAAGGVFMAVVAIDNILLTVLAVVGMLFAGVVLALSLSMTMPVCVVERAGPVESLKRSRELTKGNLARIFVVTLVFSMLAGAINTVGTVGFLVAGTQSGVVSTLMNLIITVIMDIPLALCVVCLPVMYYQLRSVKENFNIFEAADVFD